MSKHFVPDFWVNLQICGWENARFLHHSESSMASFMHDVQNFSWTPRLTAKKDSIPVVQVLESPTDQEEGEGALPSPHSDFDW